MPARTALLFLDVGRRLRGSPLMEGIIEGVERAPRGKVVMVSGGAEPRRWERLVPDLDRHWTENMRRGETAAYLRLCLNRGRAKYAELACFRSSRMSREYAGYLLDPMQKARLHGVEQRFHVEYIQQDLDARPFAQALVSLSQAMQYRISPVALMPWFADQEEQHIPLMADPEGLRSFGLRLGTATADFIHRRA